MARTDDYVCGISIDGGAPSAEAGVDVSTAAHAVKFYVHTPSRGVQWSVRTRTRLYARSNGVWSWGKWSKWTTATGDIKCAYDGDVCEVSGASLSVAQGAAGSVAQVQVQFLNVNWGGGVWVKDFQDGTPAIFDIRFKPTMPDGYQGIVSRDGRHPQVQLSTSYISAGTFSCDGIEDASGRVIATGFSSQVVGTSLWYRDVCDIPVDCFAGVWVPGETLRFINPRYVTPLGCEADWESPNCLTGKSDAAATFTCGVEGYDAVVGIESQSQINAAWAIADGAAVEFAGKSATVSGIPLDRDVPVIALLIVEGEPDTVIALDAGSARVPSKSACVIDYAGGQIVFGGSPNLSHAHTGSKELYSVRGSRLPKAYYGSNHTHTMTLDAQFDSLSRDAYALPPDALEALTDAGTCVLRAPFGGRWSCSVDDASWNSNT